MNSLSLSQYLTSGQRRFSVYFIDAGRNVAMFLSNDGVLKITSIQLFDLFSQVVFWNSSLGTLHNG